MQWQMAISWAGLPLEPQAGLVASSAAAVAARELAALALDFAVVPSAGLEEAKAAWACRAGAHQAICAVLLLTESLYWQAGLCRRLYLSWAASSGVRDHPAQRSLFPASL